MSSQNIPVNVGEESQYCYVCGAQTVSEDGVNLGHTGVHGRWAPRPRGLSKEERAKMCLQIGHAWSSTPCQHGSVVIICERCGKQKGCTKHRVG